MVLSISSMASYSYNQIGNIIAMNGLSYTYGTQPHAVTQVGTTNYAYDANGNMITRGAQTIAWDLENMPVSITEGGNSTTFVYDGDGNRIKQITPTDTILYVNKYYEKNLTTAEVVTRYYLGNTMVAERHGITLSYTRQDSLNSTSLVTSNNGTSLGSAKYYPYGVTRSGSVPVDEKFTGQKLDDTGLYYYNARYYDPTIGRFISADTLVQAISGQDVFCTDLVVNVSSIISITMRGLQEFNNEQIICMDPQCLNRYSYCGNNPLKYIDPSGHWNWGKFLVGVFVAAITITVATIIIVAAAPVIAAEVSVVIGVAGMYGIADSVTTVGLMCVINGGIGGLLGVGIAIQGAGEEDSDNNSDTSSDLPKDNFRNNLYTPGGHFVDLDDPY
ncbi:RHS repeat-associated core domain-containing protein [Dehalococcoides mccartyi]|uniref:RHS repeat-associated core domain-containing protein n=1 Tax=Dehalococcoides mccartyi TaxID=61435 RepID=UPI0003C8093F|nr:RHS repeat-associated core domain-containing protein [Dehalococcoides mccartyi]AHB13822.1 putative membrane protein [Dehalococcoides mccartyi GY50]